MVELGKDSRDESLKSPNGVALPNEVESLKMGI